LIISRECGGNRPYEAPATCLYGKVLNPALYGKDILEKKFKKLNISFLLLGKFFYFVNFLK